MIKNTLYFTALILAILFVMAVFSKSEGATQLEYTSPDITEITLKKYDLELHQCYDGEEFYNRLGSYGFQVILSTDTEIVVFALPYKRHIGELDNVLYQVYRDWIVTNGVETACVFNAGVQAARPIYEGDTNAENE